MSLTEKQLMEAVQKIQEMGFEIVPKETAYMPDQDKKKIADELKFYETAVEKRLDALDLSLDDLAQLQTVEYYQNGEYKGNELQALSNTLEWISLVKSDMRSRHIGDLCRHSITLGHELPRGMAPHQFDEQRNILSEKSRIARRGPAAKKERNPFRAYGQWLRENHPDLSAGAIWRKIPRSFHDEPDNAHVLGDLIFYRIGSEDPEILISRNDLSGETKEIFFQTFRRYLKK